MVNYGIDLHRVSVLINMADLKLFYLSYLLVFVPNILFGFSMLTDELAPAFTDLEASLYQISNPEMFLFRNVCYKDIGCFYNGPPFFDPLSRPISVPPNECKNTRLPLFTPANPQRPYFLSLHKTSIIDSPYRCDLPTIIISHGFFTNNKAYLQMKSKILRIGNYNIIVPNYPECAKPPYFQAVANIRAVAARVSKLMQLLMDYCGYKDASNFHLIGHSLGAHLSSYITKDLGMKVGRISGLDAAGPYFQGAPEETRLSKDDADFVDVVHTNAAILKFDGFGFLDNLGHIDFWINNGNTQPGCNPIQNVISDKGINFTDIFIMVGCSHTRATDLYAESILPSDCVFIGVECKSYVDFIGGKCPEESLPTLEMGFHNWKKKNLSPNYDFYLDTNPHKPYCKKDDTNPKC